MFTEIYNNIKDNLFNMGNTMHTVTHMHNIAVCEKLSSGLDICSCNGCNKLWVLNTRVPYPKPIEMDWELAFMIVDFYPSSNFARKYTGKVPKWFSYQGKVVPEFVPVS